MLKIFNALQLRVGDHCLVLVGGQHRHGEVVYRGRAYLSPIQVRFENGEHRWFNLKTGTTAIVAGVRKINGSWQPL